MTVAILEQLEARLGTLPPESVKHDMDSGYDAMADWIRGLSPDERAKLIAVLPAWLEETHPWHSRAVAELALRLGNRHLLAASISVARKVGIHDLAGTTGYPPWLVFDLSLIAVISRWTDDPGDQARAWLRELREGMNEESGYPCRLLGIRAWLTECLLGPPGQRRLCLTKATELLRTWRDARLLGSGLSLLHAYFASTPDGISDLKAVLTPEEFAAACPDASVPR